MQTGIASEAILYDGGCAVAKAESNCGILKINIDKPKLWNADNPFSIPFSFTAEMNI